MSVPLPRTEKNPDSRDQGAFLSHFHAIPDSPQLRSMSPAQEEYLEPQEVRSIDPERGGVNVPRILQIQYLAGFATLRYASGRVSDEVAR